MLNTKLLDFWIENNLNVLFIGEAGVGKTSIVLDSFKKHNLNWKYYSASTMDPWVDFIGVPKEVKDENGILSLQLVKPPEWANDEIEAIFLDEFNRSPKKVRNAVMELIQFKSINGRKYNKLRFVWAAINPENSENPNNIAYDVEPLDPAQKDRFHIHVELPYKCDDNYFSNKYGEAMSTIAMDWWKKLPTNLKYYVTPRRLDYALDIYKKDGALQYIFPKQINTKELIENLGKVSTINDLERLFQEKDENKINSFLKNANNYHLAEEYIIKDKKYFTFFLQYIPENHLMTLISTKDKTSQKIIEFIKEKQSKVEKFKNIVDEIIKVGTDWELIKEFDITKYNEHIKEFEEKMKVSGKIDFETFASKYKHSACIQSFQQVEIANLCQKYCVENDDLYIKEYIKNIKTLVKANNSYNFVTLKFYVNGKISNQSMALGGNTQDRRQWQNLLPKLPKVMTLDICKNIFTYIPETIRHFQTSSLQKYCPVSLDYLTIATMILGSNKEQKFLYETIANVKSWRDLLFTTRRKNHQHIFPFIKYL